MGSLSLSRNRRVRLFLDLNETLIRTGQISFSERLEETRILHEVVGELERISERSKALEIVFVTGNSFEYSRRIEEPLGIKNILGVALTIVSENGLLARSFSGGDLWCCSPTESYGDASKNFLARARRDPALGRGFYTQGNEIRLSIKPVGNEFTPREQAAFRELGREYSQSCQLYVHEFYVDLDPLQVEIDGVERDFPGKEFAVRRILEQDSEQGLDLAIGDSVSDVPMFRAVVANGGSCFWVGNSRDTESFENAEVLSACFAKGVRQVLRRLD